MRGAERALAGAPDLGGDHEVDFLPAMLGVMLWRYDEYSQPHAD
ncbi:MAG: hypothetical protein ACR2KY_02930 [Thermoleophilaceae bacterium]